MNLRSQAVNRISSRRRLIIVDLGLSVSPFDYISLYVNDKIDSEPRDDSTKLMALFSGSQKRL